MSISNKLKEFILNNRSSYINNLLLTKMRGIIMKILINLIVLLTLLFLSCDYAQVESDYEIYSNPVENAVSYKFFLEKKPVNGNYTLFQDADYITDNLSSFIVGSNTQPSFTIKLRNDGNEYTVGVVAVDSNGFYSPLSVAVANVGKSPNAPGGVSLRKK